LKKKDDSTPFNTSLLWYGIGIGIPMLILLIKSPIYTRVFSPNEYGNYSIISITFSYLSLISFKWISSAVYRYYIKYKKQNQVVSFTGLVLLLFSFSTLLSIAIASIWYFSTTNPDIKQLILWGTLFFLSEEFINIWVIPLKIDGLSKRANFIIAAKSILTFITLLTLTFTFHYRIEAFFLAPVIINMLCLPWIFNRQNPFKFKIIFNKLLWLHLHRFFNYGGTALLFNLSLYILTASDRYFIQYFYGNAQVGIYSQIYNLAEFSIAGIFSVLLSALNPSLLKGLSANPNKSNSFINQAFFTSLYITLPLLVILIVFAKQISYFLLGPDFRDGYTFMPYVLASAMLLGLSNFGTIKLKFTKKNRQLIWIGFGAGALNMLLNYLLMPHYDYPVAAKTTLLAYIFFIIATFRLANLGFFTDLNIRIGLKQTGLILILLIPFLIYLSSLKLFGFYWDAILLSLMFFVMYIIGTLKVNPFLNRKHDHFL
jgi:O-antigen/teichoic acid export membrane protein